MSVSANCGRVRKDPHPGPLPGGEGAKNRRVGFLNRTPGMTKGNLAPVAAGSDAIALEAADEGGMFW